MVNLTRILLRQFFSHLKKRKICSNFVTFRKDAERKIETRTRMPMTCSSILFEQEIIFKISWVKQQWVNNHFSKFVRNYFVPELVANFLRNYLS